LSWSIVFNFKVVGVIFHGADYREFTATARNITDYLLNDGMSDDVTQPSLTSPHWFVTSLQDVFCLMIHHFRKGLLICE